MKSPYPKNKEHFKRLIPFAQKIISICKEVGAEPIIYGSFAHFYHTKDKAMEINDIDLMIPEQGKNFPKIVSLLRKKNIKFEYLPKWETMIITNGKLRVEIDSVRLGYEGFDENKLFGKEYDLINFYGLDTKLFKLKYLEDAYVRAYLKSTENKDKIMKKIKRLEKFLGRKLKNPISVELIKNKNLSKPQKDLINRARVREFGKENKKNFLKDYEPETIWIFVKDKNKIVSLGGIRPIILTYNGKKYNIGGICSVISLVKEKGYGKIIISFMKNYSFKTGKSILGFTADKNIEVFKKLGLNIEKEFIRRFIYVKPNGEEIYDNEGAGIYYEGKDKIISKILKRNKPVYINVLHW